MMTRVHSYHLDDAPQLRSCNLVLRSLPGNPKPSEQSEPIVEEARLRNFYGKQTPPRVKYVRERKRLDYGNALEEEYEFELLKAGP
jgi:N4-bis(aminopropyl)spermidine synthase